MGIKAHKDDEEPIGPESPELDEDMLREDEESSEEEEKDDMSALAAAEESKDEIDQADADDLFASFDPENDEDGMDEGFNDPNLTHLDPPSSLGGRTRESELFGQRAIGPMGRSTSPRLYAQASQFPTCTQLRVWKWENGIPVGLGVIDSQANEEDLIQQFHSAMPRVGEGRCQFKLRPIDITGQEMGQEINLMISEHHSALQQRRRMMEDDESEDEGFHESATAASEMSRMYDRMMEASSRKTSALEAALESERDRMRNQDENRAQERIDLATNAAQGVQVLTERMMQDEARRTEAAIKMQQEQSQTMVTTLTSIFAQQQQMMQASMEAARRNDEYRLEQERQRAVRERQEADLMRERERREADEKFRREREEAERKMVQEREYLERRMVREHKEMEFRLQREREESERKNQREREEREARERWLSEERNRRALMEMSSGKERESERQRRHDRMMSEVQAAATRDREHAERMMSLSKIEMSNKAMGGLGELLPKASGFLKEMGLEPADVMQRVLAPQDEGSGTTELLSSLLGVAGEVAKSALQAKAPPPPPVPMMGVPPQHMLPPPQPQLPPGTFQMPPQPQMANSPEPQIQTSAATGAGLSLGEQKAARTGLRSLIGALERKPKEEWEEAIVKSISAQPVIYRYIQGITVRSALYEVGASDAMVHDVIEMMKSSPLVPDDIPYGIN